MVYNKEEKIPGLLLFLPEIFPELTDDHVPAFSFRPVSTLTGPAPK